MQFHEARPLLQLLTDSSKELEELRSAFTRALEYLKQEVEERKCGFTHSLMRLSLFRWTCLLCQRLFVSKFFSNFGYFFLKGFSESGDPSCMIMQNWARIEVSIFDRSASDSHL